MDMSIEPTIQAKKQFGEFASHGLQYHASRCSCRLIHNTIQNATTRSLDKSVSIKNFKDIVMLKFTTPSMVDYQKCRVLNITIVLFFSFSI